MARCGSRGALRNRGVTLRECLDRTLLLMREQLNVSAPDTALLDALSLRIVFVADRANLGTPEGQSALVSAAMLCARTGAHCYFEIPPVPCCGVQIPLRGPGLVEGLFDLGADLLPGRVFHDGRPNGSTDIAFIVGDSPWSGQATHIWHLSGDGWTGSIWPHGARWEASGSPFGGLIAGALAGGEAYKTAMRRLRHWAADLTQFDDYFTPTAVAQVSLAPAGINGSRSQIENIDIVSGGAVTHATLFALARVPDLFATARVIEPGVADAPDLNRYALLRRSDIGLPKAASIAACDLGGVRVTGLQARFDDESAGTIGPLAQDVLVGVDEIPSRWAVQRTRPTWLGVGATTHYAAQISFHASGLPCAICLHPRLDDAPGPAPTVAFVSFWAGLWLASRFISHAVGDRLAASEQQVFTCMLQPDQPGAIWRSPVPSRPDCPIQCPLK